MQVTQRLEAAALMATSPANIGHRLITTTVTTTTPTTQFVVTSSKTSNI